MGKEGNYSEVCYLFEHQERSPSLDLGVCINEKWSVASYLKMCTPFQAIIYLYQTFNGLDIRELSI